MAIIRALQLTIISACFLFFHQAGATACEKTQINFYGKNRCSSEFAGFFNIYRQKHPTDIANNKSENSNWIIKATATNGTRRGSVFLATHSINQKLSDSGPTRPAKMLIRCLDNKTAVLFEFPGYEMSDFREFSEVVYHTGGKTDDILELSLASDKSVLGVWQGFRAIPFVRSLFEKQKLQILATAKNGTDLEANFNITGIEKTISGLRQTCEW